MASDILIVDDEADIRDLVAGILDDEGFSTRTARDSDSALAEIANRRPHLVFLDIWLQGSKLDGLQLLEQIKKDHPDLPIVMISGHGNIETAVAAIKRGAWMRLRFAVTGHSKNRIEVQEQAAPDRPAADAMLEAALSSPSAAETKASGAETNGPAEATNSETKIKAATGN